MIKTHPYNIRLCDKISKYLLVFALSIFSQLNAETLTGTYTAWKVLLTTPSSFSEIQSFIKNHPHWPRQSDLRKRAEGVIDESVSANALISWFQEYPALTAQGSFWWAKSLIRAGDGNQAGRLVKNAWRTMPMDIFFTKKFYNEFNNYITYLNTYERADWMLCHENTSAAKHIRQYTTQIYRELIDARIALIKEQKNADQKAESLRKTSEKDEGLIFDLVRYYRRKHRNSQAIQLLSSASKHEEKLPEHWWAERHILARRMMESGRFTFAFKLIKDHQLKEGENFLNAEWMIGWFDLRHNKKPKDALKRFKNLYHKAKSPISKARMAFWAGESFKSMGSMNDAEVWYQHAAAFAGTFYGQMAQSRLNAHLNKDVSPIELMPPHIETRNEREFLNFEMVRVLKTISRYEDHQFLMPILLKAISELQASEHHFLLLKLVQQRFGEALAAKAAREIGKNYAILFQEAFPILSSLVVQKIHKIASNKPHLAYLVHAIIWCESGFNMDAKSPAGAMGLMQIMPAVAAKEAKRFPSNIGVKLPAKKNSYHPERNVLLGSSHLNYLLDSFSGNLVMTIAAYNAGANAVAEWVKCFGDPRSTKNDMIDWIELISYGETRNYVQRVLEKFMIYLHRLKHLEPKMRDLSQFLNLSFS